MREHCKVFRTGDGELVWVRDGEINGQHVFHTTGLGLTETFETWSHLWNHCNLVGEQVPYTVRRFDLARRGDAVVAVALGMQTWVEGPDTFELRNILVFNDTGKEEVRYLWKGPDPCAWFLSPQRLFNHISMGHIDFHWFTRTELQLVRDTFSQVLDFTQATLEQIEQTMRRVRNVDGFDTFRLLAWRDWLAAELYNHVHHTFSSDDIPYC